MPNNKEAEVESNPSNPNSSSSSSRKPVSSTLIPASSTAAPPGRLQASDFPIQNLDLSLPTATTSSFGLADRERPKLNRQVSNSSNSSAISLASSGHHGDGELESEINDPSDHGLQEVEEETEQEQEVRNQDLEIASDSGVTRGRGRKRLSFIKGHHSDADLEEEEEEDLEDKRSLLSDTRHLLEDAASIFDPNAYLKSQAWEEESNAGNSSSFSRVAGTSINHSPSRIRFASGSRSRSRQRGGDEESQIESGGMTSSTDEDEIEEEEEEEEDRASVGPGTSLLSSRSGRKSRQKKRTWSRGGMSNSSLYKGIRNPTNDGSTLSFTPLQQPNHSHLRFQQGPQSMQDGHHPYSHSNYHPSGSNVNLPLESSITLREALVSHSTNPGSNLGLILIAISQLGYSFMNLFVKILDEREGPGSRPEDRSSSDGSPLGALEIVATECFIMWAGCVIAMRLAKTEHILLGPPGTRLLLFIRGFAGFTSTYFLYLSLQALTLSDATCITFLGPLVTGVLAFVLLGENFTLKEALAGIGSLCGVVLIARPEAIFGRNGGPGEGIPGGGDVDYPLPPSEGEGDDSIDNFLQLLSSSSSGSMSRSVAVLISLLGVLAMSCAWVSLRCIGKKASTYHSIQYFSLVSWVSSAFLMIVRDEPFVWPQRLSSLFFLIMIGVMSLIAQVFQTLGLQREKAGRAAVVSYGQILFATLWQLILFKTPLEPLSVIGSLLILINGLWVSLSNEGEARGGAH